MDDDDEAPLAVTGLEMMLQLDTGSGLSVNNLKEKKKNKFKDLQYLTGGCGCA